MIRLPCFNIDNTELDLTLDLDKDSIEIILIPRDYEVKFTDNILVKF